MRQYQESHVMKSVQSRRVVLDGAIRPARVVFENGVITSVEHYEAGSNVLEFGDRLLLPGLVDTHVHVNEPGRTEWEGFRTATRAAAAGGVTCLVDMPLNSIPATITVEALQIKRQHACEQSAVDYAFWGGVVRGNAGEIAGLARAGVRGFKCFMVPSGVDEFEMVTEADLRLAMPAIAETGLPLLVHAEWPAMIADSEGRSWHRYEDYLASRPDVSECAAIELLIRLCQEYRCRVHVVHLASGEPVKTLKTAREEGLPISVETCPHYLHFCADEIADGATQFKCAPPIRHRSRQEELWDALQEGVIDFIASDHSPCPPELKRMDVGDFANAWGGIASLSLGLSVIYTEAERRGLPVTEVVRWMSENPARLAGLEARKGRIAVGCDADFVVFNPDAKFTVATNDLHFRHAVTPYLGQRLQGRVEQTFVRGELVFANGEIVLANAGTECKV